MEWDGKSDQGMTVAPRPGVYRVHAKHTDWATWWPGGWIWGLDLDNDYVPGARERPEDLPYNPRLTSTYGAPYETDSEHHAEHHRAPWATGSADGEDWANPGHQSSR